MCVLMDTNGNTCGSCGWPVDAECGCEEVTCCLRCGHPIERHHQLCRERTPASPFCWAEELEEDTLEIQGGLRIRPGSSQGAPLVPYGGWDPYNLD